MHLNLNECGIKLLNLRKFIESKQIYFMYKIIKSDFNTWNIIGKNWLKYLDCEYNIDYFVCKCTRNKSLNLRGTPNYYQECISLWVKFRSVLSQKDTEISF